MTEMHVLLVHGTAGPWHWQRWLDNQLRELGLVVDVVQLPSRPRLHDWLPVLRERMSLVPDGMEFVVAAHADGAGLWLHHAATAEERWPRADRVLLVSPPAPCAIGTAAVRRVAGLTRLVAGTGDPELAMHEVRGMADALHVEVDSILDGARLDTEAGYGPWPAALRWVLYGSVPLTDRFDDIPRPAATGAAGRLRSV
ncbi:alpha/beta hydrolase [Saccharopolyspora sp. HNM0983]|uniref:Alpha/beta hydrolase n=1 Tax=Saccharopolyspora montiporae TaxID=2781240 RepID=A0A929FXB5_9PSEU|nr:alpha/beta hydrolase [Saccharopolyspora sp. HNM0983]MBE9374496.1 alpha/beta hydrolase [Saccharopolyspora sp. HNM0983]